MMQNVSLTHLPLDKMATIFADDIFICIFMKEKFCILIKISLKFLLKCPIDNNTALVQIMAWRRSADKPSSEPILSRFAYMRHWGEMSLSFKCCQIMSIKVFI